MNDGRDDQAFERRLAAAQEAAGQGKRETARKKSAAATHNAINLAMRLGVELVAAMVIAVVIGWGLDKLFHTAPWLMILMVPVGMAAGLRNLIRATGRTAKD